MISKIPLSKRIIPCLDVDQGLVLKGVNFKKMERAGDPVNLAKKYRDDGADELVFLDITASVEKRDILQDLLVNVASELDIPFTVGGGMKTIDDVRFVLFNGADKVSVNTAAVENPDLISDLSDKFGSQCIVSAIDAKLSHSTASNYEVFTYGARKSTGIDVLDWAKQVEKYGAGEILLTSIDSDGTKNGYDVELTRLVSDNVNIPIIASGGCGSPDHIYDVLTNGNADAALAASIFHYDVYPIPKVKNFLLDKGVSIRL